MKSASTAVQSFLPVKFFFELQLFCDWDRYGRVPVNCIISYILKKREKTKFLIALHWYDSSYQGYLTEEVCIIGCFFFSYFLCFAVLFFFLF